MQVLLVKFHFFNLDLDIMSFLSFPDFSQKYVTLNCLLDQGWNLFQLWVVGHLVFNLERQLTFLNQDHLLHFEVHFFELFGDLFVQSRFLDNNRFFPLFPFDIGLDRALLLLNWCALLAHVTYSCDSSRCFNWFFMLLCLLNSLDRREKHFGVGLLLSFPVDFDLALDQTNLVFDPFAFFPF